MRAMTAVATLAVMAAAVAVSAQMPTYCGRSPFDTDHPGHPAPLTVDAHGNALSLVQVQILHRHGDRTSTQAQQCWEGDNAVFDCPLEASTAYLPDAKPVAVPRLYRKVYKTGAEVTPGDCFVGQLTTRGHDQHVANGQDLRAAYVDTGFLAPDALQRGDVHLRTTDVPRTVQSISALLQGLFPATAVGPDGRTEVVDIETRDSALEDLVPQSAAWLALQREAIASPGYTNGIAPYVPAMQAIFASVNTTITDFGALSDCLNAHACHSYPLPINQSLFDAMTMGTAWAAYYTYTYPTVAHAARVGMGPYYATVLDRLTAAVTGRDGADTDADAAAYRMYIDSGHDSSVMPFIAGLQASDGLWASYAVYATIELYAVQSQQTDADAGADARADPPFAVRFVYRGNEVKLPYCAATLCTFAEFSAYLKSVSPAPVTSYRDAQDRVRVSADVRDAAMTL